VVDTSTPAVTMNAKTVIPSGQVLQLQQSGYGNVNLSGSNDITGTGGLTINNPLSTSASNLNIVPGYKAGVATSTYVTYDIPSTGTHYFWDNVEVSGGLTVDGTTTFNGPICYNGSQGTGYSTMPAITKFYFTFTATNIPANSQIGSYHAYPTGKSTSNLVSIQAYMYDGGNFIGTNYLQSTSYAFSVAGNGSGIGLFTASTWGQTTGTKTFYVWIECT
jgi:hypothetical protein